MPEPTFITGFTDEQVQALCELIEERISRRIVRGDEYFIPSVEDRIPSYGLLDGRVRPLELKMHRILRVMDVLDEKFWVLINRKVKSWLSR